MKNIHEHFQTDVSWYRRWPEHPHHHYTFALTFLLLSISLLVSAPLTYAASTTYYVSQAGSDGNNGTSLATPWKTVGQVNSRMFQPGDSILFKRGETFYGKLIPTSAGTGTAPITYGTYSNGTNPKISGLSTLPLGANVWAKESRGVYSTPLSVSSLNVVTINGESYAMGRTPNVGYLSYESHVGNTSITDNQLGGTINWTGAELVIRKLRWIIDRHVITGQSGGTLTYNTAANVGASNNYHPVDGNGYFIQDHKGTLDQFGEWYYDPVAQKLYVYFGSSTPSAQVVKASTTNSVLTFNPISYVDVTDIDFEGGNTNTIEFIGAYNLNLKNVNIRFSGFSGMAAIGASAVTIMGGSVVGSNNNGIHFEHNNNNITIDGTIVRNSGIFPGMGNSGDTGQVGINVSGDNTIIRHTRVTNSGYNGISFVGNNVLVEENYVDSFGTNKDDGGGIYTVISESGITASNRIIRKNVVLNAIGAFAGAESNYWEPYGKMAGIYLDDYTNHVQVLDNAVSRGPWAGIIMNGGSDNQISGNNVYDFQDQVLVIVYGNAGRTVRNFTMTGNKFIAKTAGQRTMHVEEQLNESPSLWGIWNNNSYSRPLDDATTIIMNKNYAGGGGAANLTLANWQSLYNQDAGSSKSPRSVTTTDDLRFEYNDATTPKTMTLSSSYTDFNNTPYSGTVTIQPWSSLALIKGTGVAPDTTHPTVTLTAPANGATVANTITVSATASDNVGVTKVDFYADATLIASASAIPYTTTLDTKTLSNGSHMIKATASDAAGNVKSATAAVTVTNTLADTTAPAVSITSPANGALLKGNSTMISVIASDNIAVQRVEIWIDNVLTTTLTTSPYNYNWNTKELSSGNHIILAKAYDAAGNMSQVSITVTK